VVSQLLPAPLVVPSTMMQWAVIFAFNKLGKIVVSAQGHATLSEGYKRGNTTH
jgi:putative copper export protein